MDSNRPINLNLWRLKFPIMAIVSILHRISGIIIFLCLPFLLYVLHQSLISQESFNAISIFLDQTWVELILWVSLVAVLYHLFAGIRHLMMDLGIGEGLAAARASAYVVLVLAVISAILSGVWLWLV